MYVFSIIGIMFCEGGNTAMRIWQRVCLKCYKDCVSKVLHPSLNAVIHSVLVSPRVHQATEANTLLVGYYMGAKHFACVCYTLHVDSESVAVCLCFHVLAQSH